MFDYAEKIKPILLDLDAAVSIHSPVLIERDLIPLFKRHSGFSDILLYPIASGDVLGMHVGNSQTGVAHIFFRGCSLHGAEDDDLEPSCPECQAARFIIAKELVHTLDGENDRTQQVDATDMLIDQLVRGAFGESEQAFADGSGQVWAIELLARYRHRIILTGNGILPASLSLVSAQKNDDYGLIARSYAIPKGMAEAAFSDRYMDVMKNIRASVGLPITVPE